MSILAVSVFSLGAQTQIDLASQSKRVDFSGASTTKPSKTGSALPGTCSTGESFFKLDAAPGANLYGCTGTNTWTQMSAGGGSLPSLGGQANKVLSNDGSAAQWRALGGDLTGAPDAATVARIQGRSVGPTAPADGQALIWSNALGRWEPGTGGGGGGAASYTPTRNSATELGLGAITANAYRVGEVGCAAVGSSTFTVTSGTGTLWIAVGSDCTVKVRHNIVGVCSANCTAVPSSTSFDPGDLPLYQWDVTSGALAATGTLKLTPYVSRPLVAGTNVSFGHTGGVTTINSTGGGGGGGDASTNTSTSVDGEAVLFSGTGGKTFKRSTLTGVLKSTSGVPAVVTGTASDCVKVDGSSGSCGGAAFDPLDLSAAWVRDEFMPSQDGSGVRTLGQLGWAQFNNPTRAYSATNLGARHAGILRFTNTSGSYGSIALSTDAVPFDNPFAITGWEMKAVFRVPVLSGIWVHVGLYNAAAANPTDRVSILYADGTDTNWQCAMRAASGTEFKADTGVVVSASTWVAVRLRSTVAGTVRCSVAVDDGAGGALGAFSAEKTICASGCDISQTVPAVDMTPYFFIYHPTTGSIDIDKFFMSWGGL